MKDGGPAFPGNHVEFPDGKNPVDAFARGMTLRDYFAAKVIQGMMANSYIEEKADEAQLGDAWIKGLSKTAYFIADAMLIARLK